MWLRVLVVFVLCFYSFGDLSSFSRIRTRRQNLADRDKNLAIIEFFNNCSCVYNYQCDKEGFIITDGQGLFTQRIDDGTDCQAGKSTGNVVCCKHRPVDDITSSSTTPTSTTSTKQPEKPCGWRADTTNRIFVPEENEQTPEDGEFPWLVAIFKEDEIAGQWHFKASGSLIHPKVVMTANHKVLSSRANDLRVIVNGRIRLSQIGRNLNDERNIAEIIKNPKFRPGALTNDVALLILEEPYDVLNTPYINTLCLRPNISFENKRCFVAGWGKTIGTLESVTELKKIDLPTLSHSKCEELIGKALRRRNFEFHESLMCAGGEQDKDACKGDGGSPLMCHFLGASNVTYPYPMYQVGIVAWGVGCGKKDIPGAYANVQFAHSWIVDRLKERNISLD